MKRLPQESKVPQSTAIIASVPKMKWAIVVEYEGSDVILLPEQGSTIVKLKTDVAEFPVLSETDKAIL